VPLAQTDETNLANQVRSQDKILSYLKLRLSEFEKQTEQIAREQEIRASNFAATPNFKEP
jgi:hypothetical protein